MKNVETTFGGQRESQCRVVLATLRFGIIELRIGLAALRFRVYVG